LDIKKYTSFKKRVGYIKDKYEKSKKQLSGILGSLIEMIREHT